MESRIHLRTLRLTDAEALARTSTLLILPVFADTDGMEGPDPAPIPVEAAENPEEHQKRLPLVWIPATLGVGLLIAVVYLGGRIVTAHPHAKAEAKPVVAQTATPIPVTPPASDVPEGYQTTARTIERPPAAARESAGPVQVATVTSDNGFPMIAPQAGQRYIQVAALDLGMEATRRFVERLRNQKLDPHVAPGPKPDLMRVLIGPFDRSDALDQKKAELEAEGIATFIRQY